MLPNATINPIKMSCDGCDDSSRCACNDNGACPSPSRRSAKHPAKRFTADSSAHLASSSRLPPSQIPQDILHDEELNASIQSFLPSNYNFEIYKTIHHIRHYQSTCVALQMPEGLTLWATAISDIIER